MDSRMIGCFSSQSVSPVVVFLTTDDGGDVAGVDRLDVLTVVGVHLQDTAHTLVRCPWWQFSTVVPASSVPEYTRKKHELAHERDR